MIAISAMEMAPFYFIYVKITKWEDPRRTYSKFLCTLLDKILVYFVENIVSNSL